MLYLWRLLKIIEKDEERKENLSKERLKRWDKQWTFYKYLLEEEKEQDRVYARKIINLLKQEKIN